MEKYLIELLETNNRVIVPDLGAFIIRQQEPRELVFNDLLAFNDGMLTSHIKQQEGISMSKAQVKIEEFVDQVKKVLTKGDIYHLENLGYLKMDDSSKIEFSVTPFPAGRAAVISATTLGQEEEVEETPEEEKDIPEETPVQEEDIIPEEEPPLPEVPEEEAPVSDVPEEEDIVLDVSEEIFEEGAPAPEIPVEGSTEKESMGEEDAPLKTAEGDLTPEDTVEIESTQEEVTEEADTGEEIPTDVQEGVTESGTFTLEEQAADVEVDASEDKPLIPDAEEPPFLIEEQEQETERRQPVVGTSQARLQAAAEAAADDELKTPEGEQEPAPEIESSIPYYVENENRIKGIWPWVGGAAALIIILLVAAWFFFPDKVNRILEGKSSEIVIPEEQIPDESIVSGTETEAGSGDESAAESVPETGQDPETVGGDTDEVSDAPEETAVQEDIPEDKPEPEPPSAGQTQKYYIVAGMFSNRSNAENLVATLISQGHDAELFGRKNNLYGVSFSSHVSRAEALQELGRIREEANPKAWLLYY